MLSTRSLPARAIHSSHAASHLDREGSRVDAGLIIIALLYIALSIAAIAGLLRRPPPRRRG